MDAALLEFLRESLQLWGVRGIVEPDVEPAVAAIAAVNGTRVTVAREVTGPFRWRVHSRAVAQAGAGAALRSRPCASLSGVLTALRRALDVDRGASLQVAAPPPVTGPRAGAHAGTFGEALHADSEGGEPRRPPSGAATPVTIVTGFLGSGKTTLLTRLLRQPDLTRTAVIINEFGEIGLDHDLVETSDESFVALSNGCLCCRARSDLVLTLRELAVRRAAGSVPAFERVIIETSGLADPAPILHALMAERDLCGTYALEAVVTTVDVLTGTSALERHIESVNQVAVADRIVLTKTDVSAAQVPAIRERIASINPRAAVVSAPHGDIRAADLFMGFSADADRHAAIVRDLMQPDDATRSAHWHRGDVTSYSIVLDEPIRAVTLALFLSALAENCGADLLRMKGIVRTVEEPQRPAVVHGVQHVYHAPIWLDRWPSDDHRSRMIFIGRNLRERWLHALLLLTEREVREELRLRAAAAAPA